MSFTKEEREASIKRINEALRVVAAGLRKEEQRDLRLAEIARLAEYGGAA